MSGVLSALSSLAASAGTTVGMAVLVSAATAMPSAAIGQQFQLETVAQGLDRPWALAFLPSGEFLVTEKPGLLRRVSAKGQISPPIQGLPAVEFAGQGGLLDVVPDRDFERSRALSLCYTEPGTGKDARKNGTALARAKLNAAGTALEQVRVIFRQQPKMEGRHHFGCRIVESADGAHLFLTLGERYMGMQQAQTLDNHLGKVVRIDKSGRAPADNPFVNTPGALPEIYSLGHRNPQGALLDAQGQLWIHEHGPQGGDEINRIQPGRNYGWPVITYGENYGGGPIGEGLKAKPGMEQPVWQWTPSIAPSGFAQISSERYGASWKGRLLLGSLKFRQLWQVELDAQGQVQGQPQVVLEDVGRLRDVRQGPDGFIYLLTEDAPGRLLRLKP